MERSFSLQSMKGEQLELEQLALRIRERAGLAEDDFADAVGIVTRLLGPTAIVYDEHIRLLADRELHHQATYLRRRPDGTFEIAIRPGAPDLRFRLLHEVAHVELASMGFSLADEEKAANYVAAAVMAPAQMMRRAHDHIGERLKPIAKAFGLSQTATQLRLGEVLEDERVVVTKNGNVFVRSQGAFPWADVPIVDVARSGVRWKGLAKAQQLRGGIDEGRIALRARR